MELLGINKNQIREFIDSSESKEKIINFTKYLNKIGCGYGIPYQKLNREIKQISSKMCMDWVLKKHYAKRKPRMQYCFGLFIEGVLQGVITYGYPATPFVSRGLCGKEYEKEVLELSRLVINSNVPKNSASFLVGNSLKMLPKEFKIIVSYADTSMNHKGYIYQATNFIYTGLTIPMKEWRLKDRNLHSQNVCKKVPLKERENNPDFEQIYRPQKHRYIRFLGNKTEIKERKSKLKYKIQQYPKGKSDKYDCIDIKQSQQVLSNLSATPRTLPNGNSDKSEEFNMGLEVQKSKISSPKLSPTEITSPNPNIKLNKIGGSKVGLIIK